MPVNDVSAASCGAEHLLDVRAAGCRAQVLDIQGVLGLCHHAVTSLLGAASECVDEKGRAFCSPCSLLLPCACGDTAEALAAAYTGPRFKACDG